MTDTKNKTITKKDQKINSASGLPLADKKDFIIRVYRLFIYSLLFATMTSFVGVKLDFPFSWWWVALEFVAFLVIIIFRNSIYLLYLWTSLSGFTIAPILKNIISEGKENIIWQAILATTLLFVILSFYVHFTKKDFSHWVGILFSLLILLVLCVLLFIIFPNNTAEIATTASSIFLFSAYVLYDTSTIIHKYGPGDEVSAAVDLHLDFVNLFWDFVNIFRRSSPDNTEETIAGPVTNTDITDLVD